MTRNMYKFKFLIFCFSSHPCCNNEGAVNAADILCTIECIKISCRTVTVKYVYKHDMAEGLTAKLSATNKFTFTHPCIMVTVVLKLCSNGTFKTTRAKTRLLHRTKFRIQKKICGNEFLWPIFIMG
jgi:hypothetical protein